MCASHLLLECFINEDNRTAPRAENSLGHPDADFCPHLSPGVLLPSFYLCFVSCWAQNNWLQIRHWALVPYAAQAAVSLHLLLAVISDSKFPRRKSDQTPLTHLGIPFSSPGPHSQALAISDFVFLLIHHQERNEFLTWAF